MAGFDGATPGSPARADPWRVRVRDAAGRVRGAGALISGAQVLTCAHLLDDGPVRLDLVAHPDLPARSARVAGWVPADRPHRGDVALLDLDEPVDGIAGAPLRRLAPGRGRTVWAFGFPDGPADGTWAAAMVGGPDRPTGEWVELVAGHPAAVRVGGGFAGAGVLDDQTGTVLGIVVGVDTGAGRSWMLPLDTIVGHLPAVARYATGAPAADPAFYRLVRPIDRLLAVDRADLLPAVRRLVDWLAGGEPGGLDVFGGASDTERATVLAAVALLADPAERPGLPEWLFEPDRADLLPPVGCVDVAVDATGRTAAELAARIAARVGGPGDPRDLLDWLRSAAPPITVLLDAVDAAADPAALAVDLLEPLAEAGLLRGVRTVVGLRSRPADRSDRTTSVDLGRPADPPADPVPNAPVAPPAQPPPALAGRLDELHAAVEEVAAATRLAARQRTAVARVVANVPAVDEPATGLRLRVTALRVAAAGCADPADPRLAEALAAAERATGAALDRMHDARRELARLGARPGELRGLLRAYHARSDGLGLAADPMLVEAHRVADAVLRAEPVDLSAAERAVDRYLRLIWDRYDGPARARRP